MKDKEKPSLEEQYSKRAIQKSNTNRIIFFVVIGILLFGYRTCKNTKTEAAKHPTGQKWEWVVMSPKGSIIDHGDVRIIHMGSEVVFETEYEDDKWATCEINTNTQNGTWIQSDPLPDGSRVAELTGWVITQYTNYQPSYLQGYKGGKLMYIKAK